MRVYVATAFARKDEAGDVMLRLGREGHAITVNWTRQTFDGLKNGLLIRTMVEVALLDARGVHDCEAFVLLHDVRCRAANVELGMALGLGKLVIVVGGLTAVPDQGALFYMLPEVIHVESIDKLVEVLRWAETKYAAAVEPSTSSSKSGDASTGSGTS